MKRYRRQQFSWEASRLVEESVFVVAVNTALQYLALASGTPV